MQLSDARGSKPVAIAQAHSKAAGAGSVCRALGSLDEEVPSQAEQVLLPEDTRGLPVQSIAMPERGGGEIQRCGR